MSKITTKVLVRLYILLCLLTYFLLTTLTSNYISISLQSDPFIHINFTMSESLLATLQEGLIYVLAREATTRDIDLVNEAQCAGFDEDLLGFVSQVINNIDNEEKYLLYEDECCSARLTYDVETDAVGATDVPSLLEKEEPCDTWVPNEKATQLRKTIPNKKK